MIFKTTFNNLYKDCGRIDYIFMVDAVEGRDFLPLHCLKCGIDRQSHGDELSDHYPIVAKIIPSPATASVDTRSASLRPNAGNP